MSYTRRDYEGIALVIRHQVDDAQLLELKDRRLVMEYMTHIAKETAEIFSSSNPKFDRNRFYKDCGLYY